MTFDHKWAPIGIACTVNDDVLPDATPSDKQIEYADVSTVSYGLIGEAEKITLGSAPSRARRLAQPGDVVISTVRTYLRAIAPVGEKESSYVFSTGFAVLRPRQHITNSRYLSYAMGSAPVIESIINNSNGVGYPAINPTDLIRIRIPLPPLETQRRIAAYLDRQTGQIDETITRIDRAVELMSERHQALLRGQVLSERYPRVSLGLLTEIANGSTPNKNEPGYWSSADHSEAVPWMSSTVVNQPTASTPTAFVTPRAVKECHLPTALPGDILVAITGQGKTRGMATILTVETTLNQHVVSVRPNKKITSEFLVTALRALYDELRRESESNGSTRAAITIEQLERFQIPLPDLDEQVAITDEIASAQSNTELMLHKASHLRSLLEERRSALITAAVTGRIEV